MVAFRMYKEEETHQHLRSITSVECTTKLYVGACEGGNEYIWLLGRPSYHLRLGILVLVVQRCLLRIEGHISSIFSLYQCRSIFCVVKDFCWIRLSLWTMTTFAENGQTRANATRIASLINEIEGTFRLKHPRIVQYEKRAGWYYVYIAMYMNSMIVMVARYAGRGTTKDSPPDGEGAAICIDTTSQQHSSTSFLQVRPWRAAFVLQWRRQGVKRIDINAEEQFGRAVNHFL